MHRLFTVALLILASPVLAQAQPVALDGVRIHEAYAEHPLVVAVRSRGYLAILDREKVLDKRFPTDRAWAVIDAVGADGVARHAVDSFVAQGLLARLAIGPSGALRSRDIDVGQLDARQAFVLGWLRALAAGSDTRKLARRSGKVSDAGALQLLERAAQEAPGVQAIRVAHELVAAAADSEPRNACLHAVKLSRAVRDGGTESLRLAAAERVDARARLLGAACAGRELADLAVAITLPPPLPEVANQERAPASQPAATPPSASTPFVVTAPVFKGWLRDPLILRLAGGARLDTIGMADALRRDPTGDLGIVAINAAILTGKVTPDQAAEIAWQTIATRHVAHGESAPATLALAQLTPLEAVVYAYAQAQKPQGIAVAEDLNNARPMSPGTLFAAAQGKLPSAAMLGPIMRIGHQIDVEREPNRCRPIDLEDTLRGIVLRANLPEAARQPLVQALDTLLGQCKTSIPQRPKP